MQWKFWDKRGPQALPNNVKEALASQYRLNYQTMFKLRMLGKPGQVASRPVRLIRIYDPAAIVDGRRDLLTYDQLHEGNYRRALLFEGHIERKVQVFLKDRRPRRLDSNPAETAGAPA